MEIQRIKQEEDIVQGSKYLVSVVCQRVSNIKIYRVGKEVQDFDAILNLYLESIFLVGMSFIDI